MNSCGYATWPDDARPIDGNQSFPIIMIMLDFLSSGDFMQRIASSSNEKSERKLKGPAFDAQAFLDSAGVSKKVGEYRKSKKISSQGDPATSVIYIQQGGVKLSVVNEVGKEAVVAMLGPSDFIGEGCLAGQEIRMGMATAIVPTAVLVIEKKEMMRVLHAEHALSHRFMPYILTRNIRIEEDLIDQLFNSSEKRLARNLLLLARYGKAEQPHAILPQMVHETLADMNGTTQTRVNLFMDKLRKLWSVEYNRGR